MNRIIFISLLVSLLGLGLEPVDAQDVRQFYPDDSHTVFVPKKTVLNVLLSDYEVARIMEARNTDDGSDRYVGNSGQLKKTKVSENMNIPVIGFIKSDPELDYFDYYIVEYNGQVCFLSRDVCPNNSLIDTKNNDIHSRYQFLKNSIEELANDFYKGVTAKAQTAAEKLAVLTEKERSLKDSIIVARTAQKEDEILRMYNEWVECDDVRKKASKYLTISSTELSSPNTASGCDYTLVFTNTSPKVIKYLDWKGYAYNAVNDIVSCTIRRNSLIQGRVTGPIAPNTEEYSKWEAIIYNWSAKSLRMTGMTITYMDGTRVNLTGKEIGAVIGAPQMKLSFGEKQSIERRTKAEVDRQITALKDVSRYLKMPEFARSSESKELAPEREIYEKIVGLAVELSGLRKKYNLSEWPAPKKVKQLVEPYLK